MLDQSAVAVPLRLYVDVSMTLEQMVIVALVIVMLCVWSVAIVNAWRRDGHG